MAHWCCETAGAWMESPAFCLCHGSQLFFSLELNYDVSLTFCDIIFLSFLMMLIIFVLHLGSSVFKSASISLLNVKLPLQSSEKKTERKQGRKRKVLNEQMKHHFFLYSWTQSHVADLSEDFSGYKYSTAVHPDVAVLKVWSSWICSLGSFSPVDLKGLDKYLETWDLIYLSCENCGGALLSLLHPQLWAKAAGSWIM